MIDVIHNSTCNINSSDSEDDFVQSFKPINNYDLYFHTLDEPTECEKQSVQAKHFLSDFFDYSHQFQMAKTQDLWGYKEFNRSVTPKTGNNHDHLDQVILKNGFQEPIILSHVICKLRRKAYVTEGNHRLWVALKEEIPFCVMLCNSSPVATKRLLQKP